MTDDFDIRQESAVSGEKDFENALRPLRFSDFSGQQKVVENLEVFVEAARYRGEPLDHTLLHGPPGLGKTTLSNIIANELGVGFKLTSGPVLDKPGDLAMAGFVLKNTLSDNGAVTRGICQMNDAHYLTGVLETSGIEKTADGAAAGGKSIDIDSLVSMNMWALTPEFVDLLESGFVEFFEKAAPTNPLKAEYLLPIYIDELLHADKVSVKVLPTHDKWFGVTYAEDKQTVIDSFARLVADGVYKKDLFSDLKK